MSILTICHGHWERVHKEVTKLESTKLCHIISEPARHEHAHPEFGCSLP